MTAVSVVPALLHGDGSPSSPSSLVCVDGFALDGAAVMRGDLAAPDDPAVLAFPERFRPLPTLHLVQRDERPASARSMVCAHPFAYPGGVVARGEIVGPDDPAFKAAPVNFVRPKWMVA